MISVWDDAQTQCHSELLVLLALADWANDEGHCWPTIPRLSAKARLSDRAVQHILGRLIETGRIKRIPGGGRGQVNQYQVVVAQKAEQETVNVIHRKENTEQETSNGLHPLAPQTVNLMARNGEPSSPHTSYKRQNKATATANGKAASDIGTNGPSSSLVENFREMFALSKSQCEAVVEYLRFHGEEYVQAKARVVRSQPRRNAAGALLAALRDDWQSVSPLRTARPMEKEADFEATDARGRARGWKW
jgi:hypothetical protein